MSVAKKPKIASSPFSPDLLPYGRVGPDTNVNTWTTMAPRSPSPPRFPSPYNQQDQSFIYLPKPNRPMYALPYDQYSHTYTPVYQASPASSTAVPEASQRYYPPYPPNHLAYYPPSSPSQRQYYFPSAPMPYTALTPQQALEAYNSMYNYARAFNYAPSQSETETSQPVANYENNGTNHNNHNDTSDTLPRSFNSTPPPTPTAQPALTHRFGLLQQPHEVQRKSYRTENRCLLPNPLIVSPTPFSQPAPKITKGSVTVKLVAQTGSDLPTEKERLLESLSGTFTEQLDETLCANFSLKIKETSEGHLWRLKFSVVYSSESFGEIHEDFLSKPFAVYSNRRKPAKVQS